VQLERSGQLKHPMTSLGIEPATFWRVAQCLNQPHYRIPPTKGYGHLIRYVLKLLFFPSNTVLTAWDEVL
jgi:hypothetical protein